MKHIQVLAISVAALASAAVGTDALAAPAQGLAFAPSAPISANLSTALYDPNQPLTLQEAQFIWGGRNYCWYDGGWHGPGWYWCGYAYRSGIGWGGYYGWRGWRGGGAHGVWRGGGYGGHGGGFHGGGFHGGGGHGGGGHGGGGHGGGEHHH